MQNFRLVFPPSAIRITDELINILWVRQTAFKLNSMFTRIRITAVHDMFQIYDSETNINNLCSGTLSGRTILTARWFARGGGSAPSYGGGRFSSVTSCPLKRCCKKKMKIHLVCALILQPIQSAPPPPNWRLIKWYEVLASSFHYLRQHLVTTKGIGWKLNWSSSLQLEEKISEPRSTPAADGRAASFGRWKFYGLVNSFTYRSLLSCWLDWGYRYVHLYPSGVNTQLD
jgi:hypothetical protein